MAALALPAGASASFTELASFSGSPVCPSQLAFDAGGGARTSTVYVEDNCASSPGVFAYTADGTGLVGGFNGGDPLESFTYLSSTECFYNLAGAAVDPATGDLYVSDLNASALFDFTDTGTDAAQVATSTCQVAPIMGPVIIGGALAAQPAGGSFPSPHGLAIYNGNVYVAGGGLLQDTALGLASDTVGSVNLASNDPQPVAVAIDPNTGATFVIDSQNRIVDEYNSAGSYVGVFTTGFGGSAFGDPVAIAVDPIAHVVYVADAGTGVVDTFSEPTGAALLQIPGRSGYEPGGIALDSSNHDAYVAYDGTSTGAVDEFAYTPAPSCPGLNASTKGGIAVALSLSCSERSGAPVAYSIASTPAHGALSGFNPATGAVTYTPASGYTGTDTFTYTATSVDGTSQPATASITVTGPTCAAETLSSAYQAPLAVTLVCTDAASPVASYKIVTPPVHGAATTPTAGGTLTYTPSSLFAGSDAFTYEGISANGQTSAPTTVTIYVAAQLPPPVEGQSANVYYASGSVTILLPGQTTPIPLVAGFQAPLGSIIQTTNGEAGVFVEIGGQLQAANFFNGLFKLTQSPDPHTILRLLGHKIPKVRCALHPHSFSGTFTASFSHARREAGATIAKKLHVKGKPTRQLWGSGHGNFTTVGNGSSASVRGTEWAIFDYPDGTLTFDFTDSVSVYDFNLGKHVLITAGHYYFASLGKLPGCVK